MLDATIKGALQAFKPWQRPQMAYRQASANDASL